MKTHHFYYLTLALIIVLGSALLWVAEYTSGTTPNIPDT